MSVNNASLGVKLFLNFNSLGFEGLNLEGQKSCPDLVSGFASELERTESPACSALFDKQSDPTMKLRY